MRRFEVWLCAAVSAASFMLCALIASRAAGFHQLVGDGKHFFDGAEVVHDRAVMGLFVCAFCLGAIALGQLSSARSSRIASLLVAFSLMSLMSLSLSVGTYRQYL